MLASTHPVYREDRSTPLKVGMVLGPHSSLTLNTGGLHSTTHQNQRSAGRSSLWVDSPPVLVDAQSAGFQVDEVELVSVYHNGVVVAKVRVGAGGAAEATTNDEN